MGKHTVIYKEYHISVEATFNSEGDWSVVFIVGKPGELNSTFEQITNRPLGSKTTSQAKVRKILIAEGMKQIEEEIDSDLFSSNYDYPPRFTDIRLAK